MTRAPFRGRARPFHFIDCAREFFRIFKAAANFAGFVMVERIEVENLVIGAGVIGLAIGTAFARKGHEAFVLEAGPRVGCGISSRNSEVIHSGIYYPTNSLKHRLCVEGREMAAAYCDKRGISYARCGKLVVATDEREAEKVAEIAARASDNGIEGVTHLGAEAVSRLEPSIKAIAALRVRETGVIRFPGAAALSGGGDRRRRRSGHAPSSRRWRQPDGLGRL